MVSVSPSANSIPSFASASKSFSLAENSRLDTGDLVGMVVATDADTGDTLSYSLRGEDAEPFEIGSGGRLQLRAPRTFDREGKEELEVRGRCQ